MLLHSAFEEIDKKQAVERIYCLGDMIAISSDTNKVLRFIVFSGRYLDDCR